MIVNLSQSSQYYLKLYWSCFYGYKAFLHSVLVWHRREVSVNTEATPYSNYRQVNLPTSLYNTHRLLLGDAQCFPAMMSLWPIPHVTSPLVSHLAGETRGEIGVAVAGK